MLQRKDNNILFIRLKGFWLGNTSHSLNTLVIYRVKISTFSLAEIFEKFS